ncbi:MAG: N-acetylglucosamine kinase [Hyphomicrobiales bacterium]|nr:N-acetylglucosamine kinase [Hyphomicrobiales bacterium]MBV8442223.1 N-acetylglucosamine kinase [Hyphomicrobiales bacterium]
MASPIAFIGVDGGATRCRARLRGPDGAALAEAVGAAANVHVDFAAAVEVMRRLIVEVRDKSGRNADRESRIAIGFGLAGLNDAGDAAKVCAAFPGYARVRAANDATTACIGAHAGADGGLVIAGTGSAAIARVAGKETIIGGRGFAVGDDGSGAHIGLDALRAATRAYDRLAPASALTSEILGVFEDDIVAMVRWARTARPGDYGAFAPRVFQHAANGDPIAAAIVASAAAAIAALARGAVGLGAPRVALVGGVGDASRPYLEPEIAASLIRPLFDATDGAILLAGGVVASEREAAQ